MLQSTDITRSCPQSLRGAPAQRPREAHGDRGCHSPEHLRMEKLTLSSLLPGEGDPGKGMPGSRWSCGRRSRKQEAGSRKLLWQRWEQGTSRLQDRAGGMMCLQT